MKDTSDNTFHIKSEWELELNTIIDDDTWEDICIYLYISISSMKSFS